MDKSSHRDGQPDTLPTEVFGWNPYSYISPNEYNHQAIEEPLPRWAQSNHEIMQLTDLYQQQLAELASTHSLLMNDQEAFATAMEPFVEKDGTFRLPPDEKWIFMKRGLDLRLLEFEEDCRRIQQTERHLQRKIDDCTLTYETSLIEARGYAETRLIEQIQEQQKLIEYQQHELDELRFQRDLYSDETLRLRQICRFGTYSRPNPSEVAINRVERIPLPTRRSLHKEYCSEKPPFVWMQKIRHSRKIKRPQKKKQEELNLKLHGAPVTKSSSITHPWISTPSKSTKKIPALPFKSKAPPTQNSFMSVFTPLLENTKNLLDKSTDNSIEKSVTKKENVSKAISIESQSASSSSNTKRTDSFPRLQHGPTLYKPQDSIKTSVQLLKKTSKTLQKPDFEKASTLYKSRHLEFPKPASFSRLGSHQSSLDSKTLSSFL